MPTIRRLVVEWTGLTGLPGESVFYSDAATAPSGAVLAFFTAIQSLCPSPLTWTVPSSGDELDDATGTLTGVWTGGAGGSVTASGASQHAAGVGALVRWETGVIITGRRLRGRTFIAPLMNSAYDSAGTIVTGNLATLQTAANTLSSTSDIGVWHRPTSSGGSDGSWSPVLAAVCPDKVTSLRSRRN